MHVLGDRVVPTKSLLNNKFVGRRRRIILLSRYNVQHVYSKTSGRSISERPLLKYNNIYKYSLYIVFFRYRVYPEPAYRQNNIIM